VSRAHETTGNIGIRAQARRAGRAAAGAAPQRRADARRGGRVLVVYAARRIAGVRVAASSAKRVYHIDMSLACNLTFCVYTPSPD
jgi:hypothetical protein